MDQWAGIVLAAGPGGPDEVPHSKGSASTLRQANTLLPYWNCYRALGLQRIIVVVSPTNRSDDRRDWLGSGVAYAVQPEPRGTGDAVACALPSDRTMIAPRW